MKLNRIICAFLISSVLLGISKTFAQGVDAEHLSKDSLAPPDSDMKIEEEAPPPAEAPYPNAKTEESTPPAPILAPVKVNPPLSSRKATVQKTLGVPQAVAPTGRQAPLTIERPKKIDDDGNYIYDKNSKSDEVDVSKVPPPVKTGQEPPPLNLTPPIMIKQNGEYFYGYEKSPHEHSGSIKVGLFPSPNLTNPQSRYKFKDLYLDGMIPTLFFDYEKEFHRSYGDLGVRIGTGVFYAQGQGRFVNKDPERDPTYVPDVNFTMIMFPTTLTGLYHFRYSETQVFTPYIGAGGGFFVFTEFRDDNLAPKFGGAGVGVALAGLNIMVDGIEAAASRELEDAYGISHVAFNIEFTQFVGLNSNYDFTSSVVNFGFNLEF